MKFISKFQNYNIVMDPGLMGMDRHGSRTVVRPLRVIHFVKGVFNTEDPKEISFLRKSPKLGRLFFESVAPDDIVATGAASPIYVCDKGECRFQANSRKVLKEHKKDPQIHPRKKKS
jgi:hypothetical protein